MTFSTTYQILIFSRTSPLNRITKVTSLVHCVMKLPAPHYWLVEAWSAVTCIFCNNWKAIAYEVASK